MNTSDPQLDQLHCLSLGPSRSLSPLSCKPDVLPAVRDDTESAKRLAELEGPPSKGAECRGEAIERRAREGKEEARAGFGDAAAASAEDYLPI
jgi:hypothetical protein